MSNKPRIPYIIFAFIVSYMVLDFILVSISKTSYNGVVTNNAYEKGIAYNKVIKSNELQQALNWNGELEVIKLDNTRVKLIFKFFKENQPIEHAVVKVKIIRPVTDKYDKFITLKETSSGIYSQVVDLILLGQWEIKLRALSCNKEYFLNKRIVLSENSISELLK